MELSSAIDSTPAQASSPDPTTAQQGHPIESSSAPAVSQHEHSDSMVTIRLSKTEVPEAPVEEEENTLSPEDLRIITTESGLVPATTQERDHGSTTVAMEQEIESVASAGMDELVKSPTETVGSSVIAPSTIAADDDQSVRSFVSDVNRNSARQPNLGSELERAEGRGRSSSSGSSRSSGSGNVNWTELDKNEEEEERGDGTDEVRVLRSLHRW
jgi:hypothetical protein